MQTPHASGFVLQWNIGFCVLNFALGIPACWYLKRACRANANPKVCITPNANPQHKSVEYRWHWVFWHWGLRWPCTFHVVCVNFMCVGYPTQTRFQWNIGFTVVGPSTKCCNYNGEGRLTRNVRSERKK